MCSNVRYVPLFSNNRVHSFLIIYRVKTNMHTSLSNVDILQPYILPREVTLILENSKNVKA